MTAFGLIKFASLLSLLGGGSVIGLTLLIKKKLGWFTRLLAVLMTAGAIFFLDIFMIEPNWIQIHNVKIKDASLARVLGNTKVVQISDFHMNEGINYRLKRMIQKVNAQKPDLIFITGDIIDDLTQVQPAIRLLKKLKAKKGIYAVPGNTDHIVMDSLSLRRELGLTTGVDFLINESRRIHLDNGNVLWVVGVDDPKYRHAKIKDAFRGVPGGVPVLMLAHNPKIFKDAVQNNVNVLLVGDTHGGQVGLNFLIKMSDYANRTPYMKGLYTEGRTKMYVNRGIGMKTLPIRFLCRPEITILKVKPS